MYKLDIDQTLNLKNQLSLKVLLKLEKLLEESDLSDEDFYKKVKTLASLLNSLNIESKELIALLKLSHNDF